MSMRKIKEVLRLRYELKLDQRQIARSCSISVSTVHEYLKRAEGAQVNWPLPEGWDDTHLEAALYPCPEAKPQAKKSSPDYAAVHEQLRTHRHVTLQLLWEEYRQANPEGYRYSRFCELYQRWRSKLDVVLRQEHILTARLHFRATRLIIPKPGTADCGPQPFTDRTTSPFRCSGRLGARRPTL